MPPKAAQSQIFLNDRIALTHIFYLQLYHKVWPLPLPHKTNLVILGL